MREQREKHGKKNKPSKQDNTRNCYRFRAPPIELNENKQNITLHNSTYFHEYHKLPAAYTSKHPAASTRLALTLTLSWGCLHGS